MLKCEGVLIYGFKHMSLNARKYGNIRIHHTLVAFFAMQLGLLFRSGKQLLSELLFYCAGGPFLASV